MSEEMKAKLAKYRQADGIYDIDAILEGFDNSSESEIVVIEDDWKLEWFSPEAAAAEQANRQHYASVK